MYFPLFLFETRDSWKQSLYFLRLHTYLILLFLDVKSMGLMLLPMRLCYMALVWFWLIFHSYERYSKNEVEAVGTIVLVYILALMLHKTSIFVGLLIVFVYKIPLVNPSHKPWCHGRKVMKTTCMENKWNASSEENNILMYLENTITL